MRLRTRLRRHVGAIVSLAVLVPAAPAVAVEPSGTAEVVKVKIVDNRFRGGSITIDRGTVVKWRNRGDNTHTTTSDSGVWDSGNLVSGERFRRKFRRVGTFEYHCSIHPTMQGTITVV